MFLRCNILILPKSNQILSKSNNFSANFALILPKFRPNPTKFAEKNFTRECEYIPKSNGTGLAEKPIKFQNVTVEELMQLTDS